MSKFGRPMRLARGAKQARARLCLVGAVGRPPMICALPGEVSGDLRSCFAFQMGLCADQVVLVELEPGGVYEIGALFDPGVDIKMPTLVRANPQCWSYGTGEEP